MTSFEPTPFLRRVLVLDAVSAGAMGVLLAFAGGPLSPLLQLPEAALRGAGLALLPFAALVGFTAGKARPARAMVWAIVAINAVWAADSVLALALGWLSPNTLGLVFVVGQALFVALMADPALAHGATMSGSTALHAAHFGGHAAIVRRLQAAGAAVSFLRACELGLTGQVAATLAADPAAARACDEGGSWPLTGACYWGQVETARLLLEYGADPDAPGRDEVLQIRPLGAAVATPDTANPSDEEDTVLALVGLLLDAGADVNGRRKDGLTALHTAAWRGHLRVMRLLLERGADPRIAGTSGRHQGETPLDTALQRDQLHAAELLTVQG